MQKFKVNNMQKSPHNYKGNKLELGIPTYFTQNEINWRWFLG